MTVSALLGVAAFLTVALAIIGGLLAIPRHQKRYAQSKAAQSAVVGTGTTADRIFGVLELNCAALVLIFGPVDGGSIGATASVASPVSRGFSQNLASASTAPAFATAPLSRSPVKTGLPD